VIRHTLVACALAAGLAGCSSKPSDKEVLADARQQIYKSCMAKGASSKAIPGEKLEAFCGCSADRSITALGIEGVRRLRTASAPSAADNEKMKSIGPACLEQVGGR
jgi:hypothetical protein